jgi:hypothetical protein
MDGTRRLFTKLTPSGVAVLFQAPVFAASARDTTQRGAKLGITTGSLNPLPEFSGKDRLDTIVDECVQLGCGNVELAAGFFGAGLQGAAVGGQVPKQITTEYRKSREQLREWRVSTAALDRARSILTSR